MSDPPPVFGKEEILSFPVQSNCHLFLERGEGVETVDFYGEIIVRVK